MTTQQDFYDAYNEQHELKKKCLMFEHEVFDEERNNIVIEIYIPNDLPWLDKSNIKQFKHLVVRHTSAMYLTNTSELTTIIKFEGKNRTIKITSFLFNNIALNDMHYKIEMK